MIKSVVGTRDNSIMFLKRTRVAHSETCVKGCGVAPRGLLRYNSMHRLDMPRYRCRSYDGLSDRALTGAVGTVRRTWPSGVALAWKRVLENLGTRSAGVAMVASILALSPLEFNESAYAVSGGGGMGTSLAFKDFSGQDMTGKNFNKADMRGIDLTNANLEGDQMFGAICADAKFNGANMRYVDLESADLEGADLSDAILEGAMLTNTQFKKLVSIEGADFTDALIRRDVQKGLCELPTATGTNSKTGVSTRESLNCD